MMNHNNIADNVKRLREAMRMMQEQLANELGVTFQAVSKWENGVTLTKGIKTERFLDGCKYFFAVTVFVLILTVNVL